MIKTSFDVKALSGHLPKHLRDKGWFVSGCMAPSKQTDFDFEIQVAQHGAPIESGYRAWGVSWEDAVLAASIRISAETETSD